MADARGIRNYYRKGAEYAEKISLTLLGKLNLLLPQKVSDHPVRYIGSAGEVVVFLTGEDDKLGIRYALGQNVG